MNGIHPKIDKVAVRDSAQKLLDTIPIHFINSDNIINF